MEISKRTKTISLALIGAVFVVTPIFEAAVSSHVFGQKSHVTGHVNSTVTLAQTPIRTEPAQRTKWWLPNLPSCVRFGQSDDSGDYDLPEFYKDLVKLKVNPRLTDKGSVVILEYDDGGTHKRGFFFRSEAECNTAVQKAKLADQKAEQELDHSLAPYR